MRKRLFKYIVILVMAVITLYGIYYLMNGDVNMIFDMFEKDGGKKEYYINGYPSVIKSDNIIYFEYTCGEYQLKMEKTDEQLHVESTGGYSSYRDGTYFVLDYTCKDKGFTKDLQKIVEKYELIKDNGHVYEVAGLPDGIGDKINVRYDSGEEIYKSSNQSRTVPEEAGEKIYELFRKLAKKNGYDFTSEGSNVELYNDATVQYLQGTWKGRHFGREYEVMFEGNHVKIYKDGQLTDDVDYIIYEGSVRVNALKEGKDKPTSSYDYQEFSEISCFCKSNESILTMYFMKNSYSTDSLVREK